MYRHLSVLCVAALAAIGAWGLRAEALRSDEMKAPDRISSEIGSILDHDSMGETIIDTPLGEPADPSMIFLAPDDALDADAPRNDQLPASASDEDELAPSVSSAPADDDGSGGEADDSYRDDEAGEEASADEGSDDEGSADDGSSDEDTGDESDADGDGSLSPDDTGSTHDPDDDVDSRDPDDIGGAAAPSRSDDDQGEDDPEN